jgi:hypothetical protein
LSSRMSGSARELRPRNRLHSTAIASPSCRIFFAVVVEAGKNALLRVAGAVTLRR